MEPAPQVDGTVGRWTKLEHENFLKGLRDYGKDWKRIGALIQTRTVVQVRTHAQKYFLASSKQRAVSSSSSSSAASASAAPKRASKRNAAAHTPPSSSPAKRKRSDSTSSKTTLVSSTDSDSAAVSPMLGASSLKLNFMDSLMLLPPLVDSYSPTSDSAAGTGTAASSATKNEALEEFMLSSVSPLSAEDEEDEAALPAAAAAAAAMAQQEAEAEALLVVDDIETLTHASSPVVVVLERETARGAGGGPGEMENMDAFHIGHLFPKWIEDSDDDLVDDANDVQQQL